jgi:hypothetical protein
LDREIDLDEIHGYRKKTEQESSRCRWLSYGIVEINRREGKYKRNISENNEYNIRNRGGHNRLEDEYDYTSYTRGREIKKIQRIIEESHCCEKYKKCTQAC